MYLNFESKLGKLSKSSKNSEEAICGSFGRKNDMQRVDLGRNLESNTDRTSFIESSECHTLDNVTDLQRQIAELNETIGDLKNSVRARDVEFGNVQRDNERLASELKRQQRCNRNLKQQLDDERLFYQREKEHFCQEMQSKRSSGGGGGKCQSGSKFQQQHKRELEELLESLEDENKELRREIFEKSQVTYNLCIKFLRMKDSRDSLRQKLDRLLQEHLQVMAEMMEKLDEAREELNIIVSDKFQEPLPISKAKLLQIVQRNSKLVYENSTLKLHVQQLTQNIERLKAEAQKTKTINVDARTIEKLTECARRRRSEEATKMCSSTSRCPDPKISPASTSRSSSLTNSPTIHKSNDPRVVASLKSKNRGKLTINNCGDSKQCDQMEFHPKTIQSAPGIVQTSAFRQVQFFESRTNCTDGSECSLEFRDAGTQTLELDLTQIPRSNLLQSQNVCHPG